MFNVIFILIKPYLSNFVYWTAPAKHRVISTKIKKHSATKSSKKLTQRDEFLLTLMRLCLEILNEDLADRFCISPAIVFMNIHNLDKVIASVVRTCSGSLASKRSSSTKFTKRV